MIRFATPADATRIAEVHVFTWRTAYRGILSDSFLESLSVEQRARGWKHGIEADPRLVLVAERDSQIIGWISVGAGRDDDSKTEGEVYAIYVHPANWSHGIGRKLMERGEDELWGRGVSRIVLWVLEANRQARQFYEALNYVPDSHTKEITLGELTLMEVRYEKARKPVSS
ncbi:MAG: GNAT family N-acetyltransferase [Dechloromonas sp.]|nr:MAG: GNAT family N-acetyltransferase [Dechloromonas sp.]